MRFEYVLETTDRWTTFHDSDIGSKRNHHRYSERKIATAASLFTGKGAADSRPMLLDDLLTMLNSVNHTPIQHTEALHDAFLSSTGPG